MPQVNLAKPGSVGNIIITAASPIGLVAADKFRIKVKRFRPIYSVKVLETTGDGDNEPVFEHSGHLYMQFVLQGWMLSLLTIGLENLISTVENPLSVNMQVNLSASRSVVHGAILETVVIDWDRQATLVGLAITGKMNNTPASIVEP